MTGLQTKHDKLPQQFAPEKTALAIKILRAGIGEAKRIRDWAKRDEGIDALIAWQQAFVAWWDANVSPNDRATRFGGCTDATPAIPAPVATEGTGISKFQVSKWKHRLNDPEAYRIDLRRAQWRWSWSGKRGGRVIGEHGAEVPPELRVGDFREVFNDIEDGSVDLIFTDPPYDRDHVPLYEDLAKFGARVLKPGGSLLAYCGHYAILEIGNLMLPHLRWHWQIADGHDGGRYVCLPGAGVKVGWKPIIWFTNGSASPDRDIVMDCVWTKPPDKESDSWSQSLQLAEYYIRGLTDIDGLVIDPFAGCCTTLMAAKNSGRRAIGSEINNDVALIAAERLEKYRQE